METFTTRLNAWAAMVRKDVDRQADDAASSFAEDCLQQWREDIDLPYRAAYERFGLPSASWHGLARYWRRRDQ